MSGHVAGKVALVTGASGGVGTAFIDDASSVGLSQGVDLCRESIGGPRI